MITLNISKPISSRPEIFLILFRDRDKISIYLKFGKLIILSMQLVERDNYLHLTKVFKTAASIFSMGGIF
jgi:hypothetical protein